MTSRKKSLSADRDRKTWATPRLRRLGAGSAEFNAAGVNTDTEGFS